MGGISMSDSKLIVGLLVKEVRELRTQLAASHRVKDRLARDCHELRQENHGLRAELRISDELNERLRTELHELRQENHGLARADPSAF